MLSPCEILHSSVACERTPYDLVESDIEMEDLCSDVPLERTSLSEVASLCEDLTI